MIAPMLVGTLVLAFACFAIVNMAASLIAWAAAAVVQTRREGMRGGTLLAIRLFPAVASLAATVVLFVPSHWLTEARDANESFGATIYLLAALGAGLILRAIGRAAALARADRRLRAAEHPSALLPLARQADGVPGLALAGLFRTRILIGRHVAAALTAAELDVAIAHELAHRGAVDNMKRWAFYCAPDLFGFSGRARRLERDWHVAAESVADARAVNGSRQRAIDLASALVKVARLTIDPAVSSTPAWSTFNDPALLKRRVEQLMCVAPNAAPSRPGRAAIIAAAMLTAAIMMVPALAATIHVATEAAVAVLP
jgi:beta-lactamase regulating signal transducer with metallopeptidase domain